MLEYKEHVQVGEDKVAELHRGRYENILLVTGPTFVTDHRALDCIANVLNYLAEAACLATAEPKAVGAPDGRREAEPLLDLVGQPSVDSNDRSRGSSLTASEYRGIYLEHS